MRGFFSGFGNKSASNNKAQAKLMMMQRLTKGGVVQETPQEKQKKMIQAKMDEIMQKAMMKSSVSATTKKAFEQMATAKVKKQAQLDGQAVVIKKKSFGNGGKVAGDGRIYNNAGQVIGTIDPKNGDIKNKLGMKVGKYKEGFMCDTKISKMIDNNTPKKSGSDLSGNSGSSGGHYSTLTPTDDSGGSWW